MAKFKIEGVNPRIDGEYEFDDSYLTTRELHAVKKLTDLRPAEFEEALEQADPDVVAALVMVALMREGRIVTRPSQPWASEEMAAILDAPLGKVTLVLGDEEETQEADAGPPSQTPSEPESPSVASENGDFSGSSSSLSSDDLEKIPSVTGEPTSPTFSTSGPETSGI